MKHKRLYWHLLFWLTQFSVSLYNELYLSASFSREPSLLLFLQTASAVFLLLLIKLAAAYYCIYTLIPKWIQQPHKIQVYLEALAVLFLAAFAMRLMTQLIIWKWIYGEAAPSFRLPQITARFFYSLLDLLQVVGLASAIKLFRLRVSALEKEKQLVQEKLRSELLHLKSQVNPHFLFNTLNSVYALTRMNSPAASDTVMQLSKILRYMLYETGEKTIPLGDELRIIADYIELQQLRFGKRLQTTISRSIDNPSVQITPLLLLPLVENAFKHGSSQGGTISINIHLEEEHFRFGISNPASEAKQEHKVEEGIGLSNIRRQMELLYPGSVLETGSKDNIFSVNLRLNLSSYAGFELFDSRR